MLQQGKIALAQADLDRANQLDPELAEAYVTRGIQSYNKYWLTGREKANAEKALADLTKAIQLDPKNVVAYSGRGFAYYALGRIEEAIQDYDRAIGLNPERTLALVGRGVAYDEKYDHEKALADYNRAIELGNDSARTYLYRAEAYRRIGRPEKAIADAEKAVSLESKARCEACAIKGLVYFHQGELDKAMAELNEAIAGNPRYTQLARLYSPRGMIHYHRGEFEEAIADLGKSIEADPKDYQAPHNRALARIALGDYDKAAEDLDRAIQLGGKECHATRAMAIHFDRGDLDQAVADLSETIRLLPGYAFAYIGRGLAYSEQNELDRASADLNEAIRLKPSEVYAWCVRAEVLAKKGDAAAALADLKKAEQLATEPDRADELARTWADAEVPSLRNPKHAIELATKLVERYPKTPQYWLTLGKARYRNGDFDEAGRALQQSVSLSGGRVSEQCRFFLAMTLWQLGEKDEARRQYQQGVEWMDEKGLQGPSNRRARDEAASLLGIDKAEIRGAAIPDAGGLVLLANEVAWLDQIVGRSKRVNMAFGQTRPRLTIGSWGGTPGYGDRRPSAKPRGRRCDAQRIRGVQTTEQTHLEPNQHNVFCLLAEGHISP